MNEGTIVKAIQGLDSSPAWRAIEASRLEQTRSRRLRRPHVAPRLAVIALILVTVAVVVPVVLNHHGRSGDSLGASKSVSIVPPTSTREALDDDNYALTKVQLPPNAKSVTHPSDPGVAGAGPTAQIAHLVDVTLEWSIPANRVAVLAWLEGHPPTGYSVVSSFNQSLTNTLGYTYGDSAGDPRLNLQVVETTTSRTVLRADAQIAWIVQPVGLVPPLPFGAELQLLQGRNVTAMKTLTESSARTLANQINALSPAAGGVGTGIEANSNWQITFEYAGGRAAVVALYTETSGDILVTEGTRELGILVGGGALTSQVDGDVRAPE